MNFKVLASLLIGCLLLGSCKTKRVITYKKKPPTIRKTAPTVVKTPERTPEKTLPVTPKKKVRPIQKTPNTSNKSAPTFGSYNAKIENYIDQYAEIAMEQMAQYKIPASITLAQGILESGAGTGDLTMKANNHFGIKCHDWKGAKVYHDDDSKGECFRKYSTAKFSFQDHSLFLSGRGRYLSLFKLGKDDYKGWAKGFELYQYDAKILGKNPKKAKKIIGTSNQHIVKPGDTLYSISRKYKITVDQLKEFNGLGDNTIHEGQTLYVQPLPKDF